MVTRRMIALERLVQGVRNAAPRSEPIQPLERRVLRILLLVIVAGVWLSIGAVHHFKDAHEGRILRKTNIWVSLWLPERDAQLYRSEIRR